MADEIDIANEAVSRFIEESVANRARGPKLAPRGSCYNCEMEFEAHSVTPEGVAVDENGTELALKLYCDRECADDHAEYLRLRALAGR